MLIGIDRAHGEQILRPRAAQRGVRPFVLWMTGLPCSGKTSAARGLQRLVPNLAVLDGDELREWLTSHDYTREGRREHVRRTARLAALLWRHGVPSCVSTVSPYGEDRQEARRLAACGGAFAECYVRCPQAECERRDAKGMYARARAGLLPMFTGIGDPYEEPASPDLVVDTARTGVAETACMIAEFLRSRGLL